MSLSGMPSAFARAINFEALPARSCCAAEAVFSLDSTPTYTIARSGFLDTVASPLVITPGLNVDVVATLAEGAVTRMVGRLTASTPSVAVRAHNVAAAAEMTAVRKVDCILAILLSSKRHIALRRNTGFA